VSKSSKNGIRRLISLRRKRAREARRRRKSQAVTITPFTLMGLGMFFGYIAFYNPAEHFLDNRVFELMVQRTYGAMTNDVLISIPLFVLMGYVMERGALVDKMFYSIQLAFRNVPASLAVATLIVTPDVLGLPSSLGDGRAWGFLTQIYQVRSAGSWGMKGEKASSETLTGKVESEKSTRASGNSPVKVAEARRVRPGTLLAPSPLEPSKGGWMRDSSTRAMGLRSPACAQMAGKA